MLSITGENWKRTSIGMFAFASILFFGCGGEIEPDKEMADHQAEKTRDELVFNPRNVDQIRGQIERANLENNRSPKQKRLMRAAQLARGTGLVRVQKWSTDSDCTNKVRKFGSGLMTSDSRMVTAHHLVPDAVDGDWDDDADEEIDGLEEKRSAIMVSFGGIYNN